jgi:cytoskeletal protein RodZ
VRGARAILADVSIGGTLVEARHRSGLTIAEVSARTRIREGLIRAIERDEFASCGGDFYARGHIRAIAAVVGADPQALISQYDAAHPFDGPVTLDDLLKKPLPRTPRGRRLWPIPAVMLLCLGVIGVAAYQLAAAPSGRAAARSPVASRSTRPSPRPASASVSAPPPSQSGPVPAPTPSATALAPASAVAFGPDGTSDGDNPQEASLALSGDQATPWQTDWYTTAQFGGLKAGTGLLLDLGRTVTATGVTVQLGDTSGADLQVRAGTTLSGLHAVANAADAAGAVQLRLSSHPRVRYLLIWFTSLPPDTAGTYQADISGVTVTGFR